MIQSTRGELIDNSSFADLFIKDVPLLDVRAPVEFNHGAFPAAINIPLLDNEERDLVGKTYKQKGRDAAIELGQRLVSGAVKQQRLAQWMDFSRSHPEGVLYCFRGGQRSRITQQWLAEAGIDIPRVKGGYKAMRRFLLEVLQQHSSGSRFLILGGKTGSGKTRLLAQFSNSLDLEAHAAHRGSAFGPRVQPQPAQIDFENRAAIALLKLQLPPDSWLLLEDESRAIGSLSIPLEFHSKMQQSPLAVIEEPVDYRAGVILNDYIRVNFFDYRRSHPEQYQALFATYLTESLGRIKKRLGPELFSRVLADMQDALARHQQNDDLEAHRNWIKALLQHYYDPMYEYQLGKKLERIVFRGNSREFIAWAGHFNPLRDRVAS